MKVKCSCKICGADVFNRTLIDGRLHSSYHRIHCYSCKPLRKAFVVNSMTERYCPRCKSIKPRSAFFEKRLFQNYCRICSTEKKREDSRKRKQDAVDYKGGKCERCGYSKSLRALDFHHKDPSQKDFNIQERRSSNLGKIKSELDKCLLLCKNCHYEEHERLDHEHRRNP